ncbi:MAG: NADH:flavin oxidoreductase [Deltaproteobacteria bacterium]|nr:NADH:flavin oxidoreductase [Deltaproteobacteria bacterium]
MDEKKSRLFEPTQLNGMKLKNRFVRSATYEGMAAQDGACTGPLTDLMVRLAKGGVGLIITSHAYVTPEGQAGPRQLGIYKDDLTQGLKDMVQAVHEQGCPIAVQIAHSGYFALPKITGLTPLAPSTKEGGSKFPRKEMTPKDIQSLVEAFGQAARRAREAGFDAVQIHAAHGYLLSQFLSPAFNRRRDPYGGSVENRSRALMEVMDRIRAEVGPDFPVLVKLNSQEAEPGGLILEDALQVGAILQEKGIDAIELSGGTIASKEFSPSRLGILSEDKEAYFKDEAKAFKEQLQVPLMLVGGIRSFQVADRLIEKGYADYISMSRPFIREPDLINRWQSGDLAKATCLSDGKCWGPIMAGEGLRCVIEAATQKKG